MSPCPESLPAEEIWSHAMQDLDESGENGVIDGPMDSALILASMKFCGQQEDDGVNDNDNTRKRSMGSITCVEGESFELGNSSSNSSSSISSSDGGAITNLFTTKAAKVGSGQNEDSSIIENIGVGREEGIGLDDIENDIDDYDSIFYYEDIEKRLKSPLNDLILRNDEQVKLDTTRRIIQVLNDADERETKRFFSSHCTDKVTLHSTALSRTVVGLRDVLLFWALTYDIYPDGIWEQRGIDLNKVKSNAARFKIKYSFSGARIYKQTTGELFDTLKSTMKEGDGLEEAMNRMIGLKPKFYSKSWNCGANASLKNVNTDYDSDVDLFESYYSNPTSNSTTCIPLECVGVINLDFDLDNNLISAIQLDVDTRSERCERDLWTFTPLI